MGAPGALAGAGIGAWGYMGNAVGSGKFSWGGLGVATATGAAVGGITGPIGIARYYGASRVAAAGAFIGSRF